MAKSQTKRPPSSEVPEMVSAWVYALGLAALLVAGGVVTYFWTRERRKLEEAVNELDDESDDAALRAPEMSSSGMGLIGTWRHHAKAKRLARKGYVRWYKIGASMATPKWVKPESDGAGVLEYYDSGDDVTYLFPNDAMVNDAGTGAYVAIHREGEAEPINLRDPAMPPIPADRLEEIINLEAESDAPGFFDRLDIDPQMIMWLGIGAMLLVAAAQQLM